MEAHAPTRRPDGIAGTDDPRRAEYDHRAQQPDLFGGALAAGTYHTIPDSLVDDGTLAALPGGAAKVLHALIRHRHRQTGLARPSIALLQGETGLSHGGVRASLRLLVCRGLIAVHCRGRGRGNSTTWAITCCPDATAEKSARAAEKSTGRARSARKEHWARAIPARTTTTTTPDRTTTAPAPARPTPQKSRTPDPVRDRLVAAWAVAKRAAVIDDDYDPAAEPAIHPAISALLRRVPDPERAERVIAAYVADGYWRDEGLPADALRRHLDRWIARANRAGATTTPRTNRYGRELRQEYPCE